MRNLESLLLAVTVLSLASGCAGPERKLGRGINNATEFLRLGEIRRGMEQTAMWEGNDRAYTIGFIRGLHRSFARTGIGIYEIVTAPFPSYDPLLTPKYRLYPDPSIRNQKEPWGGMALPEDPVYPDSYKPGLLSDSMFDTDSALGFSGGDIAPIFPGSRFRIFDN
jgi:putative exosortase-associated protein (TIGR04073 family)